MQLYVENKKVGCFDIKSAAGDTWLKATLCLK